MHPKFAQFFIEVNRRKKFIHSLQPLPRAGSLLKRKFPKQKASPNAAEPAFFDGELTASLTILSLP